MGPKHPQAEIYAESKHGVMFRANQDRMNLDSKEWIAGKQYAMGPTCASCHMSATRNAPVTHDVGERISWTLEPVVAQKLDDFDKKRSAMKDVCAGCHAPDFADKFFTKFDRTIDHYNEKFAKPALLIMNGLTETGLLTKMPFDAEIKWTFFNLWHFAGRRARMGAAMMGPDYTQWQGFYEVAENFYTKFLPEASALSKGTGTMETLIKKTLDSPDHHWRNANDPAIPARAAEFYKERYGQ